MLVAYSSEEQKNAHHVGVGYLTLQQKISRMVDTAAPPVHFLANLLWMTQLKA